MKKTSILFLICWLGFVIGLGGMQIVFASENKYDYSKVENLQDQEFLDYVNSLGLKGQASVDFFKNLPVSMANKAIYDLYQKDGFQFYLDKYPKGAFFEGYAWQIGMGEEVTCPLAKHATKYPFTKYVPLKSPEGPIGDVNKKYRIGFTLHGFDIPSLINLAGGAVWEAQKHPNLEVTCLDAGWDDAKQARHIDTWIAQGYDGIMIWPRAEAPTGPPVERALDAGIPVVSVDRQAGTQRITHRVTGNFPANAAQNAMYLIHRLLEEKGKVEGTMVMIRQTLGGTADSMRSGHFLKVMSYFPGIKILRYYHNNSSKSESFKQVQDALMAFPELDIIWCTSAPGSLGAMEAIDMADRWYKSRPDGKKLILLSPDDFREAIKAVKDGKIDMITPYTLHLGDLGLRVMIRHLEGEKLPQTIMTPDLPMITKKKENVFGVETVLPDEWNVYCAGPSID